MDFEPSDKVKRLSAQVREFMEREVYPAEPVFERQLNEAPSRWQIPPIMAELKAKARAAGLWNLFLPESEYGAGLTNLEYAPLCEIMGRSPIAPEVFNCSAPDTGNMETLVRYATKEQQDRWLKPLLDGEIRSAFAMTEPAVALTVPCADTAFDQTGKSISVRSFTSRTPASIMRPTTPCARADSASNSPNIPSVDSDVVDTTRMSPFWQNSIAA